MTNPNSVAAEFEQLKILLAAQSLGALHPQSCRANEGIDQPLLDLESALAAHRLDQGSFVVPRFGQTSNFSV